LLIKCVSVELTFHPCAQVHPRPFFTRLPLQVPVVAVEGGVPALEAELLLTNLRLESARLRCVCFSTFGFVTRFVYESLQMPVVAVEGGVSALKA